MEQKKSQAVYVVYLSGGARECAVLCCIGSAVIRSWLRGRRSGGDVTRGLTTPGALLLLRNRLVIQL